MPFSFLFWSLAELTLPIIICKIETKISITYCTYFDIGYTLCLPGQGDMPEKCGKFWTLGCLPVGDGLIPNIEHW